MSSTLVQLLLQTCLLWVSFGDTSSCSWFHSLEAFERSDSWFTSVLHSEATPDAFSTERELFLAWSIRAFWLWRNAFVLWTMIRSIFLFVEASLQKCSVTPLLEIRKLLWSLVYPQMLGHVNTHLIPWDMQTGMCFPIANLRYIHNWVHFFHAHAYFQILTISS